MSGLIHSIDRTANAPVGYRLQQRRNFEVFDTVLVAPKPLYDMVLTATPTSLSPFSGSQSNQFTRVIVRMHCMLVLLSGDDGY
jgi:hypothetical protein